jgi:hypothetical protein
MIRWPHRCDLAGDGAGRSFAKANVSRQVAFHYQVHSGFDLETNDGRFAEQKLDQPTHPQSEAAPRNAFATGMLFRIKEIQVWLEGLPGIVFDLFVEFAIVDLLRPDLSHLGKHEALSQFDRERFVILFPP